MNRMPTKDPGLWAYLSSQLIEHWAEISCFLLTVLIDAMGIGLIFPVMPDLMTEVTGDTLAGAALWGGVLATAFAVMQFLFGPVVGNLSDRYGRRPVLLASLAIMAVDYVVMALAHTVWLLLIGRVVAGEGVSYSGKLL